MVFVLYLLAFLIFILIAVMVSEKILIRVKVIVELIFKGMGYILLFLGGLTIISLFILLIIWIWNKLHEIFPQMWSLKEIIQSIVYLVVTFIFFYVIYFIYKKIKIKTDSIGIDLDQIINKGIAIIVYFSLAFILLSVLCALIVPNFLGYFIIIYILVYFVYLFIRFIIWAMRRIRKNGKNNSRKKK